VRRFLFIFLFILIGFVLSFILFYFSKDYRIFLYKIKNDEYYFVSNSWVLVSSLEVANINSTSDLKFVSSESDDAYKVDILEIEKNKSFNDNKKLKQIDNNILLDSQNKIEVSNKKSSLELEKSFNDKILENNESSDKIKLVKIKSLDLEKKFLNIFQEYSLSLLEIHTRLFDLTSEYPDEYKEYYSEDLSVYFFWNKSYFEIKDLFNVLGDELPFTINEVNNFWEKSFYINLNNEFDDWFYRIVILYKNNTFWLRLNKSTYGNIKLKLANLLR